MNPKSLLTDDMLAKLRAASAKLVDAEPIFIFDHLNEVVKLFKTAEKEEANAKKKIDKLLSYEDRFVKAHLEYQAARNNLEAIKTELVEKKEDIKALDDFKFIRAEDRRSIKRLLDRACYFAKANSPVPIPALFLDEDTIENKLYEVDTEARIRFQFKGGGGITSARQKFLDDLEEATNPPTDEN